jgi:uncharacterized membrane protein HdeD (DUF308 family)
VPRAARRGAARGVSDARGRVTILLSGVLVVLGIVLIAETAVVGGNLGYLLGALFVLAGALRLYLSSR